MIAEIAFIVGIAAALVYLPMSDLATSWRRTLVKTLPLVAFAIAAWQAGGPPLLVVALGLAAVGDFALSRRGDGAFLYGLGAFALMQLVYIVLFVGMSEQPFWAAFTLSPVLAGFVVLLLLSTEIWLAPYTNGLRWPVRAYVVIITAMGLAALTLPLGRITFGAGYLIASDIFLALQLFRMGEDDPLVGRTGWLIWSLYVAGQALILTAIVG